MQNEATIRLSVFIGLFVCLALVETFWPRRPRTQPRSARWFTNWGLVILDSLTLQLMAILLPVMAVSAAFDAAANGYGLFNVLALPTWLEFIAALLILDFLIWFQHMITHKIPILWRIHCVHHADRDIDVTTAIRFHPVEIALSMILKIGAVYALGPAALAVIMFEILLNGCAMFNHANLKIPHALDRVLRLFIVTPDMHRVHHSDIRAEHDSNYGFSLSVWDRLFKTYTPQPAKGHDGMTIGLQWQTDEPSKLIWALRLPFAKK